MKNNSSLQRGSGKLSRLMTLASTVLVTVCLAAGSVAYAGPGGNTGTPATPGGGTLPKNAFNILMNYELGMHCTGFEFAYCCVLPPYNSILAQVVKTEKGSSTPSLLEADPAITDGLGRPYVVRDPALDSNGQFKKYVLRYWHDAQPRNDGNGAPQTSTLISHVEGNSLLMWNTKADAAIIDGNGALVYSVPADGYEGGKAGVTLGNGSLNDGNDNYWNAVWNHLYIYEDLEGGNSGNTTAESAKIRLGIHVVYPENTGAALHPMGPGVAGGAGLGNVLTFSKDEGTVVYTQMKVLENLPVMLTSPRIWEALGLPLTPFEDTIAFFADPGAVDEDSLRPYVQMKAQLHEYDPGESDGIGNPVLDGGEPVIGMGTAPIDIPNCERCHSLGENASVNSAQNGHPAADALMQAELAFWKAELGIGPGDSDWYPRLKAAAISILSIHDETHGTAFTANYDPNSTDGDASTRLGHGSVICQRCHADNVIANVKSATIGTHLIKPLTEAIHRNHRNTAFSDSLGRNGGCQGCHPAHRSDGEMSNYPITELGLNAFAAGDNRDAAGGCFVGRDVHSNPYKDEEATTPSHLNAVGSWLKTNVAEDTGQWKGIWCTNCHSQLSQEIWKAENCVDLIHGDCVPGQNPRGEPTLADVATAVGLSEAQAIAWLDPKTNDDTAAIWNTDRGLCRWLVGDTTAERVDGNVATIEVAITSGGAGMTCSTGAFLGPVDCTSAGGPVFNICGSYDTDVTPDFSVNILDFCTTPDCVAAAQGTLVNSAAVAVPMSAATDGRDHWLAPGEPHCADCHKAPYTEQSGNISAYKPFNYPRKAALFRYTRGHRDITCQGCHESTHGLYPVTKPGYVPGSILAVDQTSWDQAAGMNTDGSHGPLKCGACHEANKKGVTSWAQNLEYGGEKIRKDFDKAVSWMHTATDEADPRADICINCHKDRADKLLCTTPNCAGVWNARWLKHSDIDRVSRNTMDKVELAQIGHVAGDPSYEDPLNTVCTSCHSDDSADVSCSGVDSGEWKSHLTKGRVSQAVWEYVSTQQAGSTCGW